MLHKDLAKGRWQQMTLIQQLANIGAEFQRFAASKDSNAKTQAQARLLELLDLTIADPRFKSRLKEITRLREVVCGGSQSEILKNYFLSFAYAARK